MKQEAREALDHLFPASPGKVDANASYEEDKDRRFLRQATPAMSGRALNSYKLSGLH